MTVRMLIEGVSATAAAEDLVVLPGLEAEWRVPTAQGPERLLDPLTATATIVGITAGVLTIAHEIVRWRDRWKARREGGGKAVEKIIIEVDDRRVLLDTMTVDQIAQALGGAPSSRP